MATAFQLFKNEGALSGFPTQQPALHGYAPSIVRLPLCTPFRRLFPEKHLAQWPLLVPRLQKSILISLIHSRSVFLFQLSPRATEQKENIVLRYSGRGGLLEVFGKRI